MMSQKFTSKKGIAIALLLLLLIGVFLFFVINRKPSTPIINSVLPLSQGQVAASKDSGFTIKGINLVGATAVNFYDAAGTLLAQIPNSGADNSQNSMAVSADGGSVQVVYGAFGGVSFAAGVDLDAVKVRVVTPSGLSNAVAFISSNIPTIDSITPNIMTVGGKHPNCFSGVKYCHRGIFGGV